MQDRFKSERHQRGRLSSGLIFAAFALISLFFLLAEHRAHLFGWLPYLLLAACPLMHLFHRGHGGHGSHSKHSDQEQASSSPPQAEEVDSSSEGQRRPHRH